jgi:flagellar motility protein MotE (MotC chaperone)
MVRPNQNTHTHTHTKKKRREKEREKEREREERRGKKTCLRQDRQHNKLYIIVESMKSGKAY